MDDLDLGPVKAPPRGADDIRMRTPRTGSAPTSRAARRRAESAPNRSRRIWGAVIAAAMVLLVPGGSMLRTSVTVVDRDLAGKADRSATVRPLATAGPGGAGSTATTRPRTPDARTAAVQTPAALVTTPAVTGTKSTKSAIPAASSSLRITSRLSGLPWPSGVFARGQGVAGMKRFGDWRGAPIDVVVDWPARQTWADIVNPDWLYDTWKNTPYTKVFGVAPVPEADPGSTMAGCAAGRYNDKWRQFGANIKAAGLDDEAVIRLGWEFNGNWYKWQATDPQQFAQCWRQIVTSAESVAPALLWDWTVNRGRGASVVDARAAYPGDAYVDIVGIDSYDMWPGVTTPAQWTRQYAGPYGLKFWSDFARRHGKRLSVPEWGVYPGNAGSNGGDNAFYITKMHAFFRSEGSHLAYEAYFNESAPYIAASIYSPTQNPIAAAEYRSLFGSGSR